jgi:hypothetical protein
MRRPSTNQSMRMAFLILTGALSLLAASGEFAQELISPRPPDNETKYALFDRVIENQKRNDAAMDLYERLERVEVQKTTGDTHTTDVKVSRVVPAGTGTAHLPVGPDGKVVDVNAYRLELEKLEKSLTWAAETGRAQHDAYEKIAKKKRERQELIGAARNAFNFTFIAREPRGAQTLLKYRMDPNPGFKPTSRTTSIYTRVRGTVWIEESSGELARIEGEVTDDISLGLFLAKVYKGSHFMQERYEMVPGFWLPSFSQYDFDGRKFLASFAMHERTFYSNYKLVGPPKEALAMVRSELQRVRQGGTASP